MKYLKHVVAVAAVLAVVSAAYGWAKDRQASEWEERAVAALDSTDTWRNRARALQEAAEAHSVQAHELAERAQRRDTIIRERVRTVRVETPPELAEEPAVVQRDSIIDDLVRTNEYWRRAFEEKARAYLLLEETVRTQAVAIDTLEATLADRPRPRSRWIPTLGVGPYTGYCPDQGTCSGIGVTLSWRIF